MTTPPTYVRISEGGPLRDLSFNGPFRAVVVLEADYSQDWQATVSEWLVGNGCLYMMAWGPNCVSWNDSVDDANLKQFDFGEIPDAAFVLTTWHDDEPLEEVFWFAAFCAQHGTIDLTSTLIVHVSELDRSEELLQCFEMARTRDS
jgi:hypothetical protein